MVEPPASIVHSALRYPALIVFLGGQAIALIIWAAHLDGRLDLIETRGPPLVAGLVTRVELLEAKDREHERRFDAIDQLALRIAGMDTQLAVVAERSENILAAIKNTAFPKAVGAPQRAPPPQEPK